MYLLVQARELRLNAPFVPLKIDRGHMLIAPIRTYENPKRAACPDINEV